jgi:hypothetical protein
MDLCLDFCAAPGGKSQIILDHLSPKQILISNEINESRNEILRETLTKWGKPNFIITQSPAANLPKLGEVFDLILLDAPCSGEGMFRKDSFARAQWSEELCTQCETTQAEIIDKAIDSLKNQGFLIYATCTYNPKENLEQIKSALKKYNLESIEIPALEEYHVEKQEKDKAIGYQFYPHKSLGEGFFVAILRKLSSENQEINSRAVAQIKPAFQNILQAKDGYELIQYRDVVSIVSSSVYDALIHIAPFKIKQTGIPVLETTYKTTNLHEYLPFVYAFLDTEIPQIEVNKDQALKILRLESDLILEKQIGENVMSCYHENPLSIMKILPNRINNKYPKNWRIRSA